MTMTLTWTDVLIRILCTVAAGAAIGFERSERGRSAGLRTVLLVALAACLAMLQANWLIGTTGKAADSFVVLDLMRLPLGILSGVGFIGAGAILRRDKLVVGVTTASTLWFATVIGLCFGGGQIALGLIGSILAMGIISGLKVVERHMKQEHAAELVVKWSTTTMDEAAILGVVTGEGLRVSRLSAKYSDAASVGELAIGLVHTSLLNDHQMPPGLRELSRRPGISMLEWKA